MDSPQVSIQNDLGEMRSTLDQLIEDLPEIDIGTVSPASWGFGITHCGLEKGVNVSRLSSNDRNALLELERKKFENEAIQCLKRAKMEIISAKSRIRDAAAYAGLIEYYKVRRAKVLQIQAPASPRVTLAVSVSPATESPPPSDGSPELCSLEPPAKRQRR